MRTGQIVAGIALIVVIVVLTTRSSIARLGEAKTQLERLADKLDSRTTPAGVYMRARPDDIQEIDPWGTPVEVTYAQGGIAETIDVRSAGPDRCFHTDDDIVTQRLAANFKGVGEGIKGHVQETAANAAKGLVKGAVDGVKESIRDSLPKPKKRAGASPPAGNAREGAK